MMLGFFRKRKRDSSIVNIKSYTGLLTVTPTGYDFINSALDRQAKGIRHECRSSLKSGAYDEFNPDYKDYTLITRGKAFAAKAESAHADKQYDVACLESKSILLAEIIRIATENCDEDIAFVDGRISQLQNIQRETIESA